MAGKTYESLASKNVETLKDQLMKNNVDWSNDAFSEIGGYYLVKNPVDTDKWDNGKGFSKKLQEALDYSRGLYYNNSRYYDRYEPFGESQFVVGDTTILNLDYMNKVANYADDTLNPYMTDNQGSTFFGVEQEFFMRQALKYNAESRELSIGGLITDWGSAAIGSPVYIREVLPSQSKTFNDEYVYNGYILNLNKALFDGSETDLARMSNYSYVGDNLEKRKTTFREFTTEEIGNDSNGYSGSIKYVTSEYDMNEKHPSFYENMMYTEEGKRPKDGDNLWDSDNNGLLYKTNKIINAETSSDEGRSSLMIRRFFDSRQYLNGNGFWSSYTDGYGLSHGRNLLKDRSSRRSEVIDGFLNPYCRVWTRVKPYDKVSYRIRPFYKNGKPMTYSDLQETQLYDGFRNPMKHNGLGWGERLDLYGAIGKNGYVNITPYSDDPKSVKNCMFSIENLAWKGSTSLLSSSQIGPSGGRIMWFPPYGLTFDERTSASWKSHEFIGRGEPIFTYTNTRRSGTLSFIILADYPSILNNIKKNVASDAVIDDRNQNDAEYDVQRFFAGCDDLSGKLSTVGGKDENKATNNPSKETPKDFPDSNAANIKTYAMRIFFPNDYSGSDDDAWGVIRYLASGVGTSNDIEAINELGANGYEMYGSQGVSKNYTYVYYDGINPSGKTAVVTDIDKNLITYGADGKMLSRVNRNGAGPTGPGSNGYFYGFTYRVDDVISDNVEPIFDGDRKYMNYVDEKNDFLNSSVSAYGEKENENIEYIPFSLLADSCDVMRDKFDESKSRLPFKLNELDSVVCCGYASWHSNKGSTISETNKRLSRERGNTAKKICETVLGVRNVVMLDPKPLTGDNTNKSPVNDIRAKKQRMAEIRFYLKTETTKPTSNASEELVAKEQDMEGITILDDIMTNTKGKRYDDEYRFFEAISSNGDNPYFKSLIQKVRYFNPAYHSITPEGLNARLTFLNQCLRQGPTHAAASTNYWMAENLPFGRPPICILRIGDFFNTEIVINDLNIIYDSDGIRYDMNQEGIGMQPMYAKVTLSFDIIGGSDLGGPIAKLQNAVSFNYYANTSVYDDRADTVMRKDGVSKFSKGNGNSMKHSGKTNISQNKNEQTDNE